MDSPATYTWTLTPEQYLATVEKIATINRRAERRGFTGRLEVPGVRATEQVGEWPNPVRERVIYRTALRGTPPAYAGWQLLAAIDTLPTVDGGHEFILRCAHGVDDGDVDRSRLQPGACEHCNTTRPNRRHTYLVRNVCTGTYKQVGSTCLKDFLGWSGTPVFFGIAVAAEELEAGFGAGVEEYTPQTILTYAYAAIEAFGWAPASFARATKTVVDEALFGPGRRADETRAALQPYLSAGAALAPQVVADLLEHLTAEHGYEANLTAALRAASVGPRELGLLCSAIPAYQRLHGTLELAARRQAVPDQWLGQEGEKLTATGTIVTDLTIDGYAYNSTRRLLVLATSEGIVKLVTAAAWAYEVQAGDQVAVVGTVKAHELYRDHKQTRLVRPRRLDTPAAQKAENR